MMSLLLSKSVTSSASTVESLLTSNAILQERIKALEEEELSHPSTNQSMTSDPSVSTPDKTTIFDRSGLTLESFQTLCDRMSTLETKQENSFSEIKTMLKEGLILSKNETETETTAPALPEKDTKMPAVKAYFLLRPLLPSTGRKKHKPTPTSPY